MFAQNEANNWYFGIQAGITFNTGSPTALTDGALITTEGCSAISDSSGNLLFYSNGIDVWDRTHNIMPNGSGLLGNFSSTQSGIIVPHPGNNNLFYVFSLAAIAEPDGLRYSVVDMTLNGGLGDVTSEKNILLQAPSTEKITAVTHANGNDIWVITHEFNSNNFSSFLIDNTGLNISPLTSSVGYTPTSIFDSIGYLKLSPDGSKLAVVYSNSEVLEILEFDDATGLVSNPIQITDFDTGNTSASRIYGLEFSPSNQFLYISETIDGVYQYDLSSFNQLDIEASKTLIIPDFLPVIDEPHQALQLGPDGKIYVAHLDYDYLGVINNPDIQGNACDYVFDGVFLGTGTSQIGLPPFIQSYFSAYIVTENNCLGDATSFQINSNQPIDSILWDFGDTTSSNLENPTHTYLSAGTYLVSVTVTSGTETSTNSKQVVISEKPTVASPVSLTQCDEDLDGFTVFDLNDLIEQITINSSNETITFYNTQLDAETNENVITNNSAYNNQVANSETLWARVENTFGCFEISEVNLNVSMSQIPNNFNRDYYQCDDGINSSDGIATFDFSAVTSEIESLFPVGQQLVISYYINQLDALTEMNPIADISNHQNIGSPNTQDIYIRVENALNSDCLALGNYITLHVDPNPLITGPVIIEQCDENNDGTEFFDTSGIESELLQGQTETITFSYIDELGNTYSSPLPNPMAVNQPVLNIFATMTATNPNNPNGGCSVETTISLVINNGAIAHPIDDFIACDDNNDGEFAFDISNVEDTILNGQTNMSVTYFDENGTVLPSPLPNPFITNSQSITVQVQSELSTFCYDETTINFVVSEQPEAYSITNDFICDDFDNDGMYEFVLSNYDSQILNTQLPSIFEVQYFDSNSNAENNINPLPNNYTVNSQSQLIYARIQNSNNPNCFDITSFELGVFTTPIAHQPEDILVCDDQTNDGVENFDLSIQESSILNGQSATDNLITYHLSLNDAEMNSNPIGTNFSNTENPQVIYARLQNSNLSHCFSTTSFQISVNEKPVLFMDDLWAICEDSTVEIIADSGFDEYLWSTGETSESIVVDTPGTYEIIATNIYGELRCETLKTISVVESNTATITSIETVDWTQNDNTIIVYVDGNGDYEYSLDGINYQDSNQFTNLSINEYTIYVKDKNGCGVVTDSIYLLYYPKFFTPNNDSYNDNWQLINSNREPNNKIYIFDRYGKLLIELSPINVGWNGTFNGSDMPASDYWFVLERQNGKTYRGHFTLKR
ncbi:T9SS type B sorting domain-containing protein [Psychroserpens sp. XSD401]|nr:T9SS type B sorting domain-containing protein [Psychroserpens luteolus]